MCACAVHPNFVAEEGSKEETVLNLTEKCIYRERTSTFKGLKWADSRSEPRQRLRNSNTPTCTPPGGCFARTISSNYSIYHLNSRAHLNYFKFHLQNIFSIFLPLSTVSGIHIPGIVYKPSF